MKKLLAISDSKLCFLLLFTFTFTLFPASGKAQYSVILNSNGTNFSVPDGSLTPSVSGNTLYGMSTTGGGGSNYGNIFSLDTNGSNYFQLLVFNGTSSPVGIFPNGSLTLSGNKLYGMTVAGGANNDGCVFSVDTNGVTYKDLFDFNSTNGVGPRGSLIISGTRLFGMTQNNVFSIDTDGSAFKELLNFNGTNGEYPLGDLTLSGYKLYGMTQSGGAHAMGCIFSIDTNGGGYIDMHDFNGTSGDDPYGSLTLVRNKLYGVAYGGLNGYGCIFSIDTNASAYTDLFDLNSSNGFYTYGHLTLAGNKLYGMAEEGGANNVGVIFSIDTGGTGYKDVFDFNGTDGSDPKGSLTLIGNTFYGMTSSGGNTSFGTVFKLDTNNLTNSIPRLSGVRGQWSVYPNPSTGIFTFSINNEKLKTKSVEVFDVLGQQVCSSFSINNLQFTIDLDSKPNGIYFYRVIGEDGTLAGEGKLVVNH